MQNKLYLEYSVAKLTMGNASKLPTLFVLLPKSYKVTQDSSVSTQLHLTKAPAFMGTQE